MYNRYVPKNGSYQRTSEPDIAEQPVQRQTTGRQAPSRQASPVQSAGAVQNKSFGLGGLLKGLNLRDMDTGDLLLILILLLLFLEGEDDEVLIVLAIVLFLGFN